MLGTVDVLYVLSNLHVWSFCHLLCPGVHAGVSVHLREVKWGNLPITPFSCHTWMEVNVPPGLFDLWLGKQFLAACNAFFTWIYITKESRGTITHLPCVTVKMVATAIVLHSGQKRLDSPFDFLGSSIILLHGWGISVFFWGMIFGSG